MMRRLDERFSPITIATMPTPPIKITQGPEVKEGEWYLLLPCSNCPHQIPVTYDPGRGQGPIAFTPDIRFEVTCPKCGHQDQYPVQQIERREVVKKV